MEPSVFLQTSESSESTLMENDYPSYLSEAEETEHLPHPDDPNDAYKTISLIGQLFKDIAFGDKQVALNRDQRKCFPILYPHIADDEADFKKMETQLFDFCYKDDPSQSLFNILKSISDMYVKNL